MKTLLTLIMPVLTFTASIASCKLFLESDYYGSAVLTLTSFLSIILLVEVLSHKKLILD
jgi:hypothetical protein